MYKLLASLLEHHLIVLRMIGEWWELDLVGQDKEASAKQLTQRLQEIDLVEEIQYIEPEETAAMRALIEAGGKIPVATFSRDYGEVRQMGPGKLEREEPWYAPVSPAEALWYRGFLYRAFDETADGLIEYYFIPEELLAQFGVTMSSGEDVAEPIESSAPTPTAPPPPPPKLDPETFVAARDDAVDDVTTILAHAQRSPLQAGGLAQLQPYLIDNDPKRLSLLLTLTHEMGLLRQTEDGFRPNRTASDWLKQTRPEQLRQLATAWSSSNFNELRHVPALQCEGSGWQNDPILARSALLAAFTHEPNWVVFDQIIAEIKQANPDFQRPDGDYDNWYIRDRATGEYLNGFEQWPNIEGRLLRYLIETPMQWLGLVDCAEHTFRLTPFALAWLAEKPFQAHESDLPIIVQPNGTIIVPQQTNRLQRFQVTRIAQPLPLVAGRPFMFRLTTQSLATAKETGIEPQRVLAFLQKVTAPQPLPASIRRAIERWSERGTEGTLEQVVVLRVNDAKVLETLRKNERTQGFIGETLGDLAVVVRNGKWEELRQTTAQLGLMLDDSGVLKAGE